MVSGLKSSRWLKDKTGKKIDLSPARQLRHPIFPHVPHLPTLLLFSELAICYAATSTRYDTNVGHFGEPRPIELL